MSSSIRIGIIGGTGLGEALLEGMDARGLETRDLETPFGPPSAPIAVGRYGQVPIAFLPRHGKGHLLNPAAVPYRANIYALKALGCTHVLASGAAGSLREEYAPGDLVVCDQLIDRTSGRSRTFYERAAVHVEFADPCCPIMRRWLLQAGRGSRDLRLHERGTYLCMNGPSFSTRAESHLHRSWGADLVGMTALPKRVWPGRPSWPTRSSLCRRTTTAGGSGIRSTRPRSSKRSSPICSRRPARASSSSGPRSPTSRSSGKRPARRMTR